MSRSVRWRTVGPVRGILARSLRAARNHPAITDVVVALALAIAAILAAEVVFDDIARFDPTFAVPSGVVPAMLLVTLPLALRRRFPLATGVAVAGGLVFGRQVFDVYEQAVSVLAVYLAIYSAARYGEGRWRVPALLAATGIVAAEIVDEIFFVPETAPVPVNSFFLVYNLVILALPWWLGSSMRTRHRRELQLADQAAELRHEREENARRAVFEERVRIARELHDVVAHHVSVMGIQAGAARRVLARRPESAEKALVAIESASRQAVVEMDHLLGVLRREGELDALAPQPGLADLDELVADVGRAGLAVELQLDGERAEVPRTVELSAYRIVQEALTNTLKHSNGRRASVLLRYRPDALELEVDDDGAGNGPPPGTAGAGAGAGGHGLIGMRERVGLHGGHLRAGPRPDGGFSVRARFPLEGRP